MKGKTRTTKQEAYHDAVARYGCVVCRQDYIFNSLVSVHHIDGRTKPHAHWLVLPLCAGEGFAMLRDALEIHEGLIENSTEYIVKQIVGVCSYRAHRGEWRVAA